MFVTNEKLLQRLDKPAVAAKEKDWKKFKLESWTFLIIAQKNILGGN